MAEKVRERLSRVGRTLLVLSGKGGVGKSTVASGLALSLRDRGFRVGLLDVDICGPSVPTLFGLSGTEIVTGDGGWQPVPVPLPNTTDGDQAGENDGKGSLSVMSIGFLLNSGDDPVIWRGPKKNAMIRQFLADVEWGDLDYLVVDTPPGTSDEHMSLVEYINAANGAGDATPATMLGAVLVSTPQKVAVDDVRRQVTMCKKLSVPVLGSVVNMDGYACPHCGECQHVFGAAENQGSDGGPLGIRVLCRIPLDPRVGAAMDSGIPWIAAVGGSAAEAAVAQAAQAIEKWDVLTVQ